MGAEARANAAAKPEIVPFNFYIPIAKVDKETRLVTGVATQEILDKQGDIVDYATAKAFFSDETLWPGNMREMHKAEAVGKKVGVEFDDDNKTITLTSRVSKGAPNTWEKVQDGTLSFYSIGGSGERKAETTADGKAAKRLFLKSLAEVSYVDNGACPTAKFEIVKTADGHLVDAEPEEPAEQEKPAALTPAEEAAKVITKATDAITAAVEATQVAKKDIADPVVVEVGAGIIRKMVEALVKAPTAARKADIIAKAQAAGPAFVLELPVAWQGDEAVAKAAAERVAKGGPETYDIDSALSAISFVNRLMANEYWETRYSTTPATPEQTAQIAMLKAACDALLRFLASEYAEQFAPDSTGASMVEIVTDDVSVEMFVKSLELVQKAGARHSKQDNEMIQKVHDLSGNLGANCAKDVTDDDATKVLAFVAREKVTQILKNAGYLPPAAATLDPAVASTPAPGIVEKAAADCKTCKGTKKSSDGKADCAECAKAAAVQPIPAVDPNVQKLETALATATTELEAQKVFVADLAKTNTALDARIKAIEALPASGGPVRSENGVDKSIGGPGEGTGADGVNAESLIKSLEIIAKESPDANIRSAAALQIVKVQQATGHNRIAFNAR